MAEVIAKSYRCDRCGADLGKDRGRQKITVTAGREGEWAMEWAAKWRDLCPACTDDVDRFFSAPPSRGLTPALPHTRGREAGGNDADH